jgi:DNA invertase Pin-like site-specific DNA recombinase
MSGQIVGYARTSTADQIAGFEAQVTELTAAGATKIFKEQVSSVAERAKLEAMLDYIREGDVVVVVRLDRLARSMRDLLDITARIEAKGAGLRILSMNLDTGTANGRLMMNVLGAVAQFERELMLERQREGIAKAKADGKYKGRQPTVRKKAPEIEELLAAGLGPVAISEKLGISRSSVYRVADAALRARREQREALLADR